MLKPFTFLLLLLLSFSAGLTQQIDSLLQIQRVADPQEKIYIHFDKSYYNPGEIIWFKAYLFTGTYPSEVSRSFYAELLDESGKVLDRKTAPIIFSGAAGSFNIDSNFSKPVAYFKAYTVSMLNGDSTFLYTKPIRILSPKALPTNRLSSPIDTKLSFLPEGGDWINGLPSTIAFIATNQQEQPVQLSGEIIDNKGAKVAEFKTLYNGMGKLTLAPEEGKTYLATWRDKSGKQQTTPLPTAKLQGTVLKLVDDGENKRFTFYRTAQVSDAQKQLHVIAYMNQEVSFKADIDMSDRVSVTGIFPTKILPSGTLKITVFDSSYKPIIERIASVNNYDYEFDGDVFMVQKNLTRRGLNKIEVMISDTIASNLSLSITDADLNQTNPIEDNIVSHLLLSSELRGKITNPYYLLRNYDSASYYLDLVMLTHGWRRYNWDHVLAGKTTAPQWKESNYLSLNGQVIGLPAGSIGADFQLTSILQSADSSKNVMIIPVDRKGKVFVDGLIFYDKAKLYFNSNNKKLEVDNSMLTLDNGLYKGYKKTWIDSSLRKMLAEVDPAILAKNTKVAQMAHEAKLQGFKSVTLGNVTVKAKTKTTTEKMEEKYVSGLFSGDGMSFDLVNNPSAGGYMDIFQYLQGKVAGLQITISNGKPSLTWRGAAPALYLNEMKTDADLISATPVSDIAYVKVIRPFGSLVSGGGNGVIAIYTRKGDDAATNSTIKGMNSISIMGYSPIKEFYSPDYATLADKDAGSDYRTTLYWNPAIYLDKSKRRIRLQFYNNDVTKRFRLILEGINADGKLIHVEKEVPNQWE